VEFKSDETGGTSETKKSKWKNETTAVLIEREKKQESIRKE